MKEKINYKKSLGQNFLYDETVLNRIYKSINPSSNDLIIEIGPGSGNLTKYLQKYDTELIAYEIDETLKPKLDKITNSKTKIIFQDFLSANIKEDIKDYQYQNLYIVANIPYYITTPIITKIIKENINPLNIILMVQKEVANRLSAKPCHKDYGYITVFLNYFYKVDILFDVDKSSFYPIPKVDSSIIKLTPIKRNSINLTKFDKFLKSAFAHKRKTLRNNINGYNPEKITQILIKYNLSLNNRAEEIPIDAYIEIINSL